MRVLLDTHTFLWWLVDSARLSRVAYRAIADEGNDILVSAASAWEITTKHRLGGLPEGATAALDVAASIASQGFEGLAISVADAERAGRLPGPHRDSFDRMLIAQAQGHSLAIVSIDAAFDSYAVQRLW